MNESRANDRFEAGIYSPNINHEESILIGRLFTFSSYLLSQDVQNF